MEWLQGDGMVAVKTNGVDLDRPFFLNSWLTSIYNRMVMPPIDPKKLDASDERYGRRGSMIDDNT